MDGSHRWRRPVSLGAALLLAGLTVARLAAGADAPPGAAGLQPSASPSAGTDRPSAIAAMVCGAEVRGDVGEALGLPAPPPATSTWADHVFTCTYRLPAGPLVLAVRDSPNPAAAHRYLAAERSRLRPTTTAAGLTDGAFRTRSGIVALSKDSDTLTVDASGLPAEFGPQQQKRTDLAYEVASVVLGCWTGDD
jgi:hypothetical protein